ncbi:MAG: hypothetical protein PHR20_01180 [Bacteroidales bacterium]|nr:hypothetical protein [Bacteroidales bacterium]
MIKENTFYYNDYKYTLDGNVLNVSFSFVIHEKEIFSFSPSLSFFIPQKLLATNFDTEILDKLVFNLGMTEAISYWKTTCSNTLIVRCNTMDNKQISWWNNLIFYGLGEFRYKNNITTSLENFVKITTDHSQKREGNFNCFKERYTSIISPVIIPVGGGKDSVVTLEELKSKVSFNRITPFVINPIHAATECIRIAGFIEEDTIRVTRTLDPLLLKMNSMGYLNGHTPFSAIVAFCTLIAAELTGSKYIALSNEASANESTVISESGDIINHQYSKTFHFEKAFREYYMEYTSPRYYYFSYLRNLSELRIAEKFSEHEEYFRTFLSCNVGGRKGAWCCNCPKCLFVYIMLSPFINKETLKAIFGKDMFENTALLNTLYELTGVHETKPFECIGTVEETRAALAKYLKSNVPTGILNNYISKVYQCEYRDLGQSDKFVADISAFDILLRYENKENFIPEDYD